jgi:hypothetical protein
MIDGIVIVDNVVSNQYVEFLNKFFINGSVQWNYTDDISDCAGETKTIGFSHSMYSLEGNATSNYNLVLPLLLTGCDSAKIKFDKILRSASFLLPPYPHSKTYKYDTPHVNLKKPHIVGLYYVNDSDGDTVFFNEKFDPSDTDPNSVPAIPENPTELHRVSPKAGRMVFFDGSIYHASTKPQSNIRCVLTFDFIGAKI